MTGKHRIALVLDPGKHSHRKIIMGVAAYVRQHTNWTLHVEDGPAKYLLASPGWHGNGIITSLYDPLLAGAAARRAIPLVGVEDGTAWPENAGKVPYFTTDSAAIGRLGAEHLIAKGFKQLAYYDHSQGPPFPARRNAARRLRAPRKRNRLFGFPGIRDEAGIGPSCNANWGSGCKSWKNPRGSWPATTPVPGKSWRPARASA